MEKASSASAAAFAEAVTKASMRYHGAVGQEWLHRVVADQLNLPRFIADGLQSFVSEAVPAGASGQAKRVARRCACSRSRRTCHLLRPDRLERG